MKTALTIAGSDSSGGAGNDHHDHQRQGLKRIIIDLKVIHPRQTPFAIRRGVISIVQIPVFRYVSTGIKSI